MTLSVQVFEDMATQFPEFYGQSSENAEDFIEKMEFSCLLADKHDPAIILRIFCFCLKGDARSWLKRYQAPFQQAQPPQEITYEGVKQAFIERFPRKVEDPDKVWHSIQSLVQGEDQSVDALLKQFNELWERWCVALGDENPPAMLKKDRFLGSLKASLRLKVELKQPRSFDEAVEMAKNKEWKMQRLNQLGITVDPKVEVRFWINQRCLQMG